MKVIILCANYEPGGAQRAVIRLADGLKDKRIQCRCFFIHRKSLNFTNEEPLFILNRKIESFTDILKVCYKLFKLLKKDKPDAVITFLPYGNILGQFVAWVCGVKTRISSHRNLSEKELGYTLRVFDYLWAWTGIYSGITAVSRSTKNSFKYYRKKDFDRIKVVNNGISFIPTMLAKSDCRRRLYIDETAFVMGNVGRLVDQKNHRLLIQILPDLKDTILVIVGKGELKIPLETYAQELGVLDRMIIIEELNTEMISLFLKAIDLFVMPSHYEGMSNALTEALHAGVPIISSDVESQKDVLVRNFDGLMAGILVPNDSPEKWVERILAVRDSPKLRCDLAEKAMIRAKDFTIENMANGFLSLL